MQVNSSSPPLLSKTCYHFSFIFLTHFKLKNSGTRCETYYGPQFKTFQGSWVSFSHIFLNYLFDTRHAHTHIFVVLRERREGDAMIGLKSWLLMLFSEFSSQCDHSLHSFPG